MDQKLYTVDEVAQLLQLHPRTIRLKIRSGDIASTRVGRQYRVSQEQLDAFCGSAAPRLKPTQSVGTSRAVHVSTVMDIDAISPEESSRITNTMIAALNGETSGLRTDCIYYEEIGKLKIIISGSVGATQDMLTLIERLLHPSEN